MSFITNLIVTKWYLPVIWKVFVLGDKYVHVYFVGRLVKALAHTHALSSQNSHISGSV